MHSYALTLCLTNSVCSTALLLASTVTLLQEHRHRWRTPLFAQGSTETREHPLFGSIRLLSIAVTARGDQFLISRTGIPPASLSSSKELFRPVRDRRSHVTDRLPTIVVVDVVGKREFAECRQMTKVLKGCCCPYARRLAVDTKCIFLSPLFFTRKCRNFP